MDGVSAAAVSQSIEAINDVMVSAQQKVMDQAEKLIKVNAEMALGAEPGKGTQFDAVA